MCIRSLLVTQIDRNLDHATRMAQRTIWGMHMRRPENRIEQVVVVAMSRGLRIHNGHQILGTHIIDLITMPMDVHIFVCD